MLECFERVFYNESYPPPLHPKIDFVLPWVDATDADWQNSFSHYSSLIYNPIDFDASDIRYRDYGLLKYWFRAVEKYAPWVNKVYFITNGQIPDWLNTECKKLKWVKHEDYIPSEFLPVFSANPIENYIHKIEGLSENFVYFNDDFFITDFVSPEYFFKNGLPNDSALMEVKTGGYNPMLGIIFNDINLINHNFNLYKTIRNHFSKWFNPKYGKALFRNLICIPWKKFPGFENSHCSQPFLKSTFSEVWNSCEEELSKTMKNKFRSCHDVNQYLFRFWQLCTGKFNPAAPYKHKKCFDLRKSDINEISELIKNQRAKEICINDSSNVENFETKIETLKKVFDSVLGEKSEFEK